MLVGVDFKNAVFPQTIVAVNQKSLDKKLVINEALLRGATEQELQADKKTYSVDALLDEIKQLNGDVTKDTLYDAAPDFKKAEKFLASKNVSTEAFRQEGVSLRVSTKKADKETMSSLEAYALDVMKPMFGGGDDNAFADFSSDNDIATFENEFGVGSDAEALSDSFDQDVALDTNTTQTPRFKGATMR